MSDPSGGAGNCEVLQEELTELALGILLGRRRADVLGHVEVCPRCRAELEQLSITADALLRFVPSAEVPSGFEERLSERLHAGTKVRERKARGQKIAVAFVFSAVLGFGGWALAAAHPGGQRAVADASLSSAVLSSRGEDLGEVYVSTARPAWMFMTIDSGVWSGDLRCEVTLLSGRVETIGRFRLLRGYGEWATPLRSLIGHVRLARLVAPDGKVVASAQL